MDKKTLEKVRDCILGLMMDIEGLDIELENTGIQELIEASGYLSTAEDNLKNGLERVFTYLNKESEG